MTWIDDAMERGLAVLETNDRKSMEDYLKETTERMIQEEVPRPRRGLSKYQSRCMAVGPGGVFSSPGPTDDDIRNDVKTVIRRLGDWKERVMDPLSNAGKPSIANTNVNINSNTASSESNASASSTVSLSQVSKAVEDDRALSDEQKAEIQIMLAEAKSAAVKGDKGLFARTGSKILGAVEQAAPTLIVKVLEFLVSQAAAIAA